MTLRFNKNVWLETLKPFNIGDSKGTAIGKIGFHFFNICQA